MNKHFTRSKRAGKRVFPFSRWLIVGVVWVFIAFTPLMMPAPGLNTPQPIGKFLDGTLPTVAPEGTVEYEVVEAFPNLEVDSPLVFVPEPGTNRIIIGTRDGLYEAFENDPSVTTAQKQPFLDLTDRTAVVWDGGMLGLTFHPDFLTDSNKRFIYVWYTSKMESATKKYWGSGENTTQAQNVFLRLSRFEVDFVNGSNIVNKDSELIMINVHCYNSSHRGGGMAWDDDGNLIVTIGEQFNGGSAQNITNTLQGGFIRIDVDKRGGSSSHIPKRVVQNDPTYNPMGTDPTTGGTVINGFVGHYAGSNPASQTDMEDSDFLSDPDKEFTGIEYYIPNDNPDWAALAELKGVTLTEGDYFEEYVTIGNRNPHRMTRDGDGRYWSGEVGAGSREEINVLEENELSVGINYGWPAKEGNQGSYPSSYIGVQKDPATDFLRSEANAIIGGYVYRGTDLPGLFGKYICGGYSQQRIFAVSYDEVNGNVTNISREVIANFDPGALITFGQDHAGEIYLCPQGPDRKIYKLATVGAAIPAPPRLSQIHAFNTNQQTGDFTGITTLTPKTGVLPYELNVPFWSDGALKYRYLAVPNNEDGNGMHDKIDEKIIFSENGDWQFPNGTVFIKHFELPVDETDPTVVKKVETRFVIKGDDGEYYYLSYEWRDDGTDADLLETGKTKNFDIQLSGGGTEQQEWIYPDRTECLQCHNAVAGHVLGAKTRQLNKDVDYTVVGGNIGNQLETYLQLNMFAGTPFQASDITNFLTLSPLDDANATDEELARSYFDSNCSYCHRPGTANGAAFDMRFSTPLEYQNIVNASLREELGDPTNKAVVPGDLFHSIVYQRIKYPDQEPSDPTFSIDISMPPLARNVVDDQGVTIVENWINGLDPADFPVGNLVPTITFPEIDPKCVDDANFLLGATSDSPVSITYMVEDGDQYISLNTSTGEVDILEDVIFDDMTGDQLLPLPATVTIVARQEANNDYEAAQATRSFEIVGRNNFTFVTNGDASQVKCTDCLIVTPDVEDAEGTAWSDFTIDLDQTFRLELLVNLGSNDGTGGDGMTFALQDVSNTFLGSNGTPMAVDGLTTSFGVEFDTWQSSGTSDPAFDHISFWANGDVTDPLQTAVQARQSSPNIETGTDYEVVIEWDPNINQLSVEFDGTVRDIYNGDIRSFFGSAPYDDVYFGFGAGTGGATNEHKACIVNLIQGGSLLNLSISSTDEDCGQGNGTATITPSGGSMPYTFAWSDDDPQNPQYTTGVRNDLSAGTYFVTVTDDNNISKTASIVINNLPGPTLEVSSTPASCNVIPADGTATVTPTPASDPPNVEYTYDWEDPQSNPLVQNTATVTGLVPGTYSVTVTNTVTNCFAITTVTVEEAAPFTLSTSSVPSPCGMTDGSATVTVDPAGTYTYKWNDQPDPNGQTTATATGLTPGTYTVTVTDANMCEATATVDVLSDCPPLARVGTATDDGGNCYTLTTPAPNNQAGAIWSPNTINLNNGFVLEGELYFGFDNSGDNRGNADGIAFALHRDDRGTSAIGGYGGSYAIALTNGTEAVAPSFGFEFDTYPNGSEPTVDHFSFWGNGDVYTPLTTEVQADPTSGNIEDGELHTIRIEWDPIADDMEVYFDGNLIDTYTGDIVANFFEDDPTGVYWGFGGGTGGATNLQQFCLTSFVSSTPISLQTNILTEANCGQATGEAEVIPTGGTPPYTYQWSGGIPDPMDPSKVGGLAAGTYFVTVTDNVGFTASTSVVMTETGCVGLVVNGVATADGGDCYTLTPEAGSQAGTAWSPSTIDLTDNFRLTAELYFGDNDPGADGIAFALHNDTRGPNAIGDLGGSFAIDNQAGGDDVFPSFGVVFKTYPTSGGDLIYVFQDGNTAPGAAVVGPFCATDGSTPSSSCTNIEDGNQHTVIFEWNATQQVLTVFFEGTQVIQYDGSVLGNVTTILGGGGPDVTDAYWGFGAGTGGAINRHEVCITSMETGIQVNQSIDFPTIESVCADAGSVQLDATATSGLPVAYAIVEGAGFVEFDQNDATILNILGGDGQVTIEANQAGNDDFFPAPPVQQSFLIEKSSNIAFTTNGDASVDPAGCDCFIVTPDEEEKAGTVWSDKKLDLTYGFSFEADIFMSEDLSSDNQDRADGITFALHNDPAGALKPVGSIGTDMAVDNLTNAFGFEFDNYAGTSDAFDIQEDHVAFWAGTVTNPLTTPVVVDAQDPNFEDAEWHRVKIDWDPATQTMTGWFDGNLVTTYTYSGLDDLVTEHLGGNPEVHFGFGGGTGGKTSLQKFCVVEVCRDVQFNITAMLQGPYNPDTDEMNNTINPMLPLLDPYFETTTAPSIPANAVDWVLVEVHDPHDMSQVIASKPCFLTTNGTIVDIDGSPGVVFEDLCVIEAYIAVKHRNHLGVMTGIKHSFEIE